MPKFTDADIHNIYQQARKEKIFPDGRTANEFGVVAAGGKLTCHWVLNAYVHGIFPWPLDLDDATQDKVLGWFCPNPRTVLFPADLHIPRRLGRKMRSGRFRVSSDQSFAKVIAECSGPRKVAGELETGTWITSEMKSVYAELYEMGIAHSIEVWQDDELVGGLYGIAVGSIFCGESMFHHVSDASRVALCVLVQYLQSWDFALLDVQQATPHCTALGAIDIPRTRYLQILDEGLGEPAIFGAVGGLDNAQ